MLELCNPGNMAFVSSIVFDMQIRHPLRKPIFHGEHPIELEADVVGICRAMGQLIGRFLKVPQALS